MINDGPGVTVNTHINQLVVLGFVHEAILQITRRNRALTEQKVWAILSLLRLDCFVFVPISERNSAAVSSATTPEFTWCLDSTSATKKSATCTGHNLISSEIKYDFKTPIN